MLRLAPAGLTFSTAAVIKANYAYIIGWEPPETTGSSVRLVPSVRKNKINS
jgi:hypothetical protein